MNVFLGLAMAAGVLAAAGARGAEPRFRVHLVDGGAAESVTVADFNRDGRPDIASAGSWYEAPRWTKHPIRSIPVTNGYVDSFSDLALDVDGDGWTDVIQIGYFARRIAWMKNPAGGGAWTEHLIDAIGPTEFAFLVDIDNDGRARELLPQFTTAARAPLTWYEFRAGTWQKHVVSSQSHGHGIGAGDINGDGRNDLLTPQGWLEAPPDPRAEGPWTFHATDWWQHAIPPPPPDAKVSLTEPPALAVPPRGAKVAPVPVAPGAKGPAALKPAEWGFLHVIDLNGDGRNDVLATSAHSYGLCWFEQRERGEWRQHIIDHSWSHLHASVLADLNGDGRPDLVTGKRFQSRNNPAPGDNDPLGLYWYEFRPGPDRTVSWQRHTIHYGGRVGGGLQMAVADLDGDGDADVVAAGKSGLYVAENLAGTR